MRYRLVMTLVLRKNWLEEMMIHNPQRNLLYNKADLMEILVHNIQLLNQMVEFQTIKTDQLGG